MEFNEEFMTSPFYLYKIYKLIKQRETRIPNYCSMSQFELRSKMATVAHTIFEGQKTKADILKIAKKLLVLLLVPTLCNYSSKGRKGLTHAKKVNEIKDWRGWNILE